MLRLGLSLVFILFLFFVEIGYCDWVVVFWVAIAISSFGFSGFIGQIGGVFF